MSKGRLVDRDLEPGTRCEWSRRREHLHADLSIFLGGASTRWSFSEALSRTSKSHRHANCD